MRISTRLRLAPTRRSVKSSRRWRISPVGRMGIYQRMRSCPLAGAWRHYSFEGNAGPSAGPSFFLLPIADVRIDDNWFTMGLAATGSKNTVVNDVFVPSHRVVSIADLLVGTSPGAHLHDNPLYRQSLLSVLPFCLVAPLLGIADGALADFLKMAKVRTTRGAVTGGNNRMAEFATIQSRWPKRPEL